MINNKPSIAIQRQIPSHIRENYPLFVDFLKAYYEFLENTQNIDLEKARDVDTSLDSFVNQFIKELSNDIPVNLVEDKRMLIKNLREFYLSRGSEASYKFLFKVLFNRDAELYYPSAQILRVSDGKWVQDVSVFVQVPKGGRDLTPIQGNFITISVTRKVGTRNVTKKFRTLAERVVQYASGVFEVYIQRDYINQIDIGSTIEFIDSAKIKYTGTILPCPAKLSIFREGRGFKVGQVFSLRTERGRGCLVKVTKTGPNGEIKGIRLMEIGLDYFTTFFSYLSNKDIATLEYIHPAKLNQIYNPGDPAYNERLGGFLEYGYASKQTYFDYDTAIPVATADKASDRFFADPDYVGELDTQFYSDDREKQIDSDLAIIKVELGAVAKYPGYYMNQDGFISDEMYIQNDYYQAFSYVIRVEEEIRKYVDVVKKILHPSGLKLFAEYTITNEISYVAKIDQIKQAIDLLSQATALERGFNYSAYELDQAALLNGELKYIPAQNSRIINSQFGKPALFATKELNDSFIGVSRQSKEVQKPFANNILISDANTKHVFKALAHSVGLVDAGFSYDKYLIAVVNGNTTVTPHPSANIVFSNKPTKSVVKRINDVQSTLSKLSKAINKPLVDTSAAIDAISKLARLVKSDSQSITDKQVKLVLKALSDTITTISKIENKSITKRIADNQAVADSNAKSLNKPRASSVTVNSAELVNLIKSITEIVTAIDLKRLQVTKNISDVQLAADTAKKSITKALADATAAIDTIRKSFNKSLASVVTLQDFIKLIRTLNINDSIFVTDRQSKNISKRATDSISLQSTQSKRPNKSLGSSINTQDSGLLVLNAYDQNQYSLTEEQYTANTPF